MIQHGHGIISILRANGTRSHVHAFGIDLDNQPELRLLRLAWLPTSRRPSTFRRGPAHRRAIVVAAV
jgi:hypothetical protein